jgi:hypothetical protein
MNAAFACLEEALSAMPTTANTPKSYRRACARLFAWTLLAALFAGCFAIGPAIAREPRYRPAPHQLETIGTLLRIYAGPAFEDWGAYRAVPGVAWDGPRTIGQVSGRAIAAGTDESGGIRVLTGVLGPAGAPADAGARVTTVALGGHTNRVETLAIRESRPRRSGAADMIADSLGVDGGARGIAFDCARNARGRGPDRLGTAFYRVDGGFARPLYLETTVEFGAARTGMTVYRFYREKPVARIVAMQCKRRAQP